MTSDSSTGSQRPRPESRTSSTLTDSVPPPDISEPIPECAAGNDEETDSGNQSRGVPASSGAATQADENEESIITSIRATDVAFLRRLPAGFYATVQHSGQEWRTENKPISVNDNVIEWGGPIPIPSDASATICLQIYASFEFQPMLGSGEQLRKLIITVKQLLDYSANEDPFTFCPDDDDVISPCPSILVTAKRWKRESNESLGPRAHRLTTESRDPLEEATNQGHSALSRYRKYSEKQDLERSLEQFACALDVCPRDSPCHAVAQSNLAMAKFIHCLADDTGISLDVPLTLYRNALAARPVGHPDRPSTLVQLAVVHFARFEKLRHGVDSAQTEVLLHEAIRCSSAGSQEKRAAIFALQLHAGRKMAPVQAVSQSSIEQKSTSGLTDENPWTLGAQLLFRFQRFGDLVNLQQAISVLEASVRSASVPDPGYLEGLTNLGTALSYRFHNLGELSDLEQAISRSKDSVDFTPVGHPDKPCRLNNLGNTYFTRFQRLGELIDLQQAISRQSDAVNLTPDGHFHQAAHLRNLGDSFIARFQRLGELDDLQQAILRHTDALDLTPDGQPDKPRHLSNLGSFFLARLQLLGDLGDLEQAISRQRDALDLTPDGHPDKPRHLSILGNSYFIRFQYFDEPIDLQQAISRQSDVVNLLPGGHPHKPGYLNQLGNFLRIRFDRLGELSDIEQAISRYRDAIQISPDGDPNKSCRMANLGNCYIARFLRLGELSDLEQAISGHRDTVELTPDGHPHKPVHLCSLGSCLTARFRRLGEPSDLEQGISRQRDAVKISPDGHPDRPGLLNNLGVSLRTRFERLSELSDLEEAISRHRDAVDLTCDGHPDKPSYLRSLGTSFRVRFDYLGELSDLEQAISRHRDAVDIVPGGHPHKPGYLDDLGNSLDIRFKRIGKLTDLEEAISRKQDGVGLTPEGHNEKPSRIGSLADSFRVRFEYLGEPGDLEQAMSLYSQAACSSHGPPNTQFHASQNWISSARALGHHSLFRAYSVAIGLLPQLAWIGLSLTGRYSELLRGADIVRDAAAAALDSGRLETAVEWLEQGRSIVWGELFQLRSSYEELSSAHPDHARRLQELSAALEHASSTREKSLSLLSEQVQGAGHRATQSLEQEADRHRMLAIERDKMLQEIRGFPGFERFLLHKEFSQLRASAHSGPVVILNAAKSRCDALIVLANKENVVHVPLPNFTFRRSAGLQNMVKNLLRDARVMTRGEREGKPESMGHINWESVLSTLWNCVVKPVLDALDISTPGDLSRIFWCPTGPFVFLPIHAAGLYGNQSSEPGHKVSDFVVSSYVPTLSILAQSPKSDPASTRGLRLLAVRQPSSDGQIPLPGVDTELEHIKEVIKDSLSARITLVESSVGTVEEVLSLMKDADWCHFACHGIQERTDTGLCLANRRRLKLSDIATLSRPRGGLAFLSACQTATGDGKLSDEAIHIAAGMLFAGYGGVVGTMWSISDKLAPRVARDVYGQLFRTGRTPDYRDAARALHNAVGHLRDNSGASFVEWLPFIHVGL